MNKEKENTYFKQNSSSRPQWIGNQPNNAVNISQKPNQGSQLPPLKETNKFSSWCDRSLFDQVDELLFENDSETKNSKLKTTVSKDTSKNDMNGSGILSLSGSIDLDSYEIDDEAKIDHKQIEQADNSNICGGDSLDLDNSDDLNKIIQKYEQMLQTDNQQQQTKTKSLEESWGQILKGELKSTKQQQQKIDDDNYDDDKFEMHEDQENIFDEEINMNNSLDKNDSDYLKELLQTTKRQQQKSDALKLAAQLDGSNDQDEIDEFIKKHLSDEDNEFQKQQNFNINSNNGSSSSDEHEDPIFEEEKKSPKEHLLQELQKLSDIFGKYSLTDREMFLQDVDSILKILTYDEVVMYVLPVLQIYANEQEFLKLQFFQKLPYLFSKLINSSDKKQETIDLLTIHIFPLISKMLINSEEQVQTEGVETLIKVCKEHLQIEDAQFLVFNIIQNIMCKSDSGESAKIAVLLLTERFSEQGIFQEKQCKQFICQYLQEFEKGMLFKIKKFLLPALLAASKHIPYDLFLQDVYSLFMKFTKDDIWGVRKVCLEKLQDVITLINPQDSQKIEQCLMFLKTGFTDTNRWVKNQAFGSFGPAIHQAYLKHKISNQQSLKIAIDQVCNCYYDIKHVVLTEEDNQICQSFMGNQNDDVDKIKYNWAFYLPCALLVNGGEIFWQSKLKQIYLKLYCDLLLSTRKTIASSLLDVMKLIDMNNKENQNMFIEVINYFLKDIDEIKTKIMPQLCEIISLYPKEIQHLLLISLIQEQLNQEVLKTINHKVKIIQQLFQMFDTNLLVEKGFQNYIVDIIEKDQMIANKKIAAKVFGKSIIIASIKNKKYRKPLSNILDKLRLSKSFRDRQMYLTIAKATYKIDNDVFKKFFAKAIGRDMINEKVKIIQICLAKLCAKVKEGYSKSIEKVRSSLKSKGSMEVLQYLNPEIMKQRRYLENKKDEDVLNQQKDEAKEKEELEKTVQIRFAGYSTMVRSNDNGSLFSSQLMALIGGFMNNNANLMNNDQDNLRDISEEALLNKVGAAPINNNWKS